MLCMRHFQDTRGLEQASFLVRCTAWHLKPTLLLLLSDLALADAPQQGCWVSMTQAAHASETSNVLKSIV